MTKARLSIYNKIGNIHPSKQREINKAKQK